MSANYKKLGDYITQRREKNTAINLPICGVCREGLIPPKQQDADISLYNVFYKNDFIFNPARMELNSITLNTEYDKAICSSLYEIFYINDTSKLLPEFLFVQLKTDNFVRFCEFQGQGSVREYCRFANISEYPVIVPDLKEQEKIVNTYNAITKRIQLKQKINENLEKTAQRLFEKYFDEYNKFYEKEELKTLPSGWKYSIIGDFCKDNIKSLSSSDKLKEILYLDTGNITNNKIEELKTITESEGFPSRAKRIVYDNDIVFSTVRPNLRHYGIIRKPAKNMIVSTGFSVLHNDSEKVSNEFLYMWITNEATLSFLQSIAENSVSTYPSINSDDLMNIKIIIPSDNILSELNEGFRKTFLMIDYNNQEITKMQELKQLVISRISTK